MSRYNDLQQLCSKYGDATAEQTKLIKKLGHAIISGFNKYLGGECSTVFGVPPDGDFEPGCDYRDECFSFYGQGLLFLEPVYMGLCVVVKNLAGNGATSVMTKVKMLVRGDQICIYVGMDGREVRISRDFEEQLGPVFAELYQDIEKGFSLEIDEFKGRRSIGFLS